MLLKGKNVSAPREESVKNPLFPFKIPKLKVSADSFVKLLSKWLKRIYVRFRKIGSCTGATGRVPATHKAGERKKKC